MEAACSTGEPEGISLARLTSDPGYSARVTEVVLRVAGASDASEALELLREATCRLGADAAAFVSFIRDDPSHESYRFLLACDPNYCAEYEHRAWYADDPWLNHALRRSEPVRAREIDVATPQQQAVVELAERYGFRSAVIVPAPSSGGLSRIGVLCIGSRHPAFFDGDGYLAFRLLARALSMELHDWWVAHIRRELMVQARIAVEDLVLLRHERFGFSTKQIAVALSKTPTSIDSQFQRLNARLGVPNRKAAAALAAEYGLI